MMILPIHRNNNILTSLPSLILFACSFIHLSKTNLKAKRLDLGMRNKTISGNKKKTKIKQKYIFRKSNPLNGCGGQSCFG